jgi:hypothetical protein
MNLIPDSQPEPNGPAPLQALRTGLLIAGSALLGGLAVVLWHRNSLSRLRQPPETASQPPAETGEEVD